MWEHPATQRNLEKLRADGVMIIDPDQGEMACGTIGPGRLSEPDLIVGAALDILRPSETVGDLAGEHLLITAGATREPIDPVRFISNRSSGRMGFALAKASRERGAIVTVIAGVTSVEPPKGVRVINVATAGEMHRATLEHIAEATIFVGAAAVADYTPAQLHDRKIKKTSDSIDLRLERTADILKDVARQRRNGQLIVGFAAETENLLENAWEKLVSKDLDAIVANDVSREGAGFDVENNAISVLLRDRPDTVELPLMSKDDAAHRILDEIVKLRSEQRTGAAAAKNK
jgi:phosphopantothenoylcysteine decarboxylase/phosphopantothenate--cysteine ligase